MTIGVQDGAKAGASLLANLLERDLVRGGASKVLRQRKGDLQLRILLKAHGLESAFERWRRDHRLYRHRTFAWSMGEDAPLQEVNLRIQKIERVDSELSDPGRGRRSGRQTEALRSRRRR